nr:hypothetical protein [Candidatus Acidoferrales bacterium]
MPGRATQIVEVRVGIEVGVAVVFPNAAMKSVAAFLADVIHLHGAFARFIRAVHCRGDGEFFYVINSRIVDREKSVAGFQQVALNVDSIKSDIDCAFWQSFKRGIARAAGCFGSRIKNAQKHGAARVKREVGDRLSADGIGDRRGLRFHQLLATAFNLDGNRFLSDFELGWQTVGLAERDGDVRENSGLEVVHLNCNFVDRRREVGDRELAACAGFCCD